MGKVRAELEATRRKSEAMGMEAVAMKAQLQDINALKAALQAQRQSAEEVSLPRLEDVAAGRHSA